MHTYQADIEWILSYKNQFDFDYWTTPDLRLLKGSPLNAVIAPTYLVELGVPVSEPVIQESVELLFSVLKEDGRFKLYPKGGIYPCYTALGLLSLCQLGQAQDFRLDKTFSYFLETQESDGGWKCNKYSYGRGPETEFSTPLTTLLVLHAFLHREKFSENPQAAAAVAFLLKHWEIKTPISPCHYGIGKLFKQVEYPFADYNLFQYVYVLSHYPTAQTDARFLEAFAYLQSKTQDGKIVVERHSPKLNKLEFCKKGQVSELATKRYQQILENLGL
ncbi:prenyltransferase/squalene oxidase repeat-containing protein [Enterococcus sp. LJL120]